MEPEQMQVSWCGVRGDIRLADLMFHARKSSRIAPVQAVRADMVLGADHIRTAAWHAARAAREGRAKAEREEVEFLRYLAAEPKIQRALAKCGLPELSTEAVLVGFGPRGGDAVAHLREALGLVEAPELVGMDEGKLRAFGITDSQVRATTPARRMDIVLELVAAVDLHA